MCSIHEAISDSDILRCFDVMHELRPHLVRDDFLPRIRRQKGAGYRMAFAADGDNVMAVAGFRFFEMLAWGKAMYVDDLVTTDKARGGGIGSRLFDWLVEQARQAGCDQFHLDSGVHRHVAHRFYLHKGMDITSHHFALKLQTELR
jgi:GNAT superfamily N-acetyltransferase